MKHSYHKSSSYFFALFENDLARYYKQAFFQAVCHAPWIHAVNKK